MILHGKKRPALSQTRIIALGFAIMILIGTLLLMLPVSSQDGRATPLLEALFTSTSASCVTGLVLVDTATHWSWFGQLVLIVLIQIGGLGFMTIATMFSLLLRRRIGLKEREIMVESLNALQIGGIVRMARKIFKRTMIIEGTGALLLSIRFIPEFGFFKGIWYGIFHAVSAFCNAGFDLMGSVDGAYASLTGWASDPYVCLILMVLIIIGGIGFMVWDDVIEKKWHFKNYRFGTKIVLTVSGFLLVVPTILFLILEWNYTGAGLSFPQQLLNALFDSVTARTAGFNTTDTASLSDASKLLTIILMLIGGSPGSTAGGVKTTTVMVLLVSTWTGMRRRQSVGIFGRRFEKDALQKAASIFFTNLFLALAGTFLISAMQDLEFLDILFEAFSAIGTVGMSTGITRDLNTASCIVIMFLMYCGRVGSISFGTALLEKRARPAVMYPEERIMIG